ncbi:MAG: glycosyl transferase [Panacagrimonas sp.]|jgi:glycosyltransferase Alg8|nr:glycosyltransferase family 2 protein [Panacagrimonas sp.]MCC2658194.1 glycosyl transferase [Panacagrimonas sp.]
MVMIRALVSASGWLIYLGALGAIALLLPETAFDPEHATYWVALGTIGLWRYSLGAVHFVRAMIFLHRRYPKLKRDALAEQAKGAPPAPVYLMVTSFRIDSSTSAAVYRSVIQEAMAWKGPATVVASIVEMADEQLVKMLWERYAPPEHVRLLIVRIPGTGKRDALAQGFRAISRDLPAPDALVAVVDGDTVLQHGVLDRTVPFFRTRTRMGALTTNEFCEVRGGYLMREWHRMRFAQRHLNMCSMALSHRVLTLTGRMSMFRACIVTDPEFIEDVENDHLDHWRLGTFKFLTGDDKSSWYSLVRMGWDTWYVPDASITTVEHPPDKSFVRASRKLMFRWYGNSLRQNQRATKLGWKVLGPFVWYVLIDQRISMWTSLLGISVALWGTLIYGPELLMGYLLWIGFSRLVLTILLAFSGHPVGPTFPLLLYYNQVVGSLMKIKVSFHLDQQSWTRQDTKLTRDLDAWQARFNRWSSPALMAASASLFAAVVVSLI